MKQQQQPAPNAAAAKQAAKYQVHCDRPSDNYGWDAWVTNEEGEVIGDGWGVEPHDARVCAIQDAEFTVGKLVPTEGSAQ